MNAERLHALCRVLKKEMDGQETARWLKSITQSLAHVAAQPNPQSQNELGNSLKQLYSHVESSPSDSFSPAWKQALDDIGGTDLVGGKLADKVRCILERNGITPSLACDELEELSKSLEEFKTAVDNVVSGLERLGIGAEELAPGECELGVLIPRQAVHASMDEFGQELQDLDLIFGTFSEVASGKRETFEIKTISSSDLMVFLAATPPVAACIAHAAEKVINVYKSLLEIKKLKGELEKQGLAEDEMKGITDHATSMMDKGIEKLTIEVVEEYYQEKDGGRKNELKNAVRIALNRLANRIDKGFNIEVRAEPLAEDEDEEGQQEEVGEAREHVERVIAAAQTLRFMKPEGGRLLELPEKPSRGKATKKE